MFSKEAFKKQAHEIIDLIADYFENIEKYPVKSQVKPREIFDQLPDNAPSEGEEMSTIIRDFQNIIMPGITHWQSPNFFAYFPANSSEPSFLAEMLTAALGAQCMKWDTSPAATELEEKVLNWIKQMTGLPENFKGVIQDTASTATLCAILTAREKFSDFHINESGFNNLENFRVYCSSETHSSVEKAVKIAGLGRTNLIKIEVDSEFRMIPSSLEKAIEQDLTKGFKPLCVIATLGTTGSTSIDPLQEISEICTKKNIWLHIDAAMAGTALILPEYRWMIKGVENVDSFVFNPHKWMFTNFDCSVYFVKNSDLLVRTFQIVPEYLKSRSTGLVNDYCDWGVPLGRRFRALKLWFVIRNFGINGIQEKISYHLSLAKELAQTIQNEEGFELLSPVTLNLVCFRYKPMNFNDPEAINSINEKILHEINTSGKAFLTHTKLNGKFALRMVIGQTNVEKRNVDETWELIKETVRIVFNE